MMSLYELAREGNVERLRDALNSDSPAVRRRAAELLGELGDEDDQPTIDALLRAAARDEETRVRGAAIDALDQVGQSAVEQLLRELTGGGAGDADWVAARRFARALSAERPELRMAAANALGRLNDPDTVPALVNALEDEDPRVRLRACHACGSIADPRTVPGLVDRLGDQPRIRHAAANALGAIASDRALSALVELLEDDDESIRRIAASALGEANNARPIEPLARALGDDSEIVRKAAVYSILELLSNVPTDRSHAVRDRVVSQLRETGDATAIEPLVEIIRKGRQDRQRRNAAWILGRVADSDSGAAIGALADALADEDERTAQFAATSLASIGGPVVESALLDRLDSDVEEGARAKAAFVLGQVGGTQARDRLEKLTDDDSAAVRKRAFAAMSKLRAGGDA